MYELLSRLLVERLAVPGALISADRTLEQLALDSLAIVELGLVIDDECGFANNLYGRVSGQTTLKQAAVMLEESYASSSSARPAR